MRHLAIISKSVPRLVTDFVFKVNRQFVATRVKMAASHGVTALVVTERGSNYVEGQYIPIRGHWKVASKFHSLFICMRNLKMITQKEFELLSREIHDRRREEEFKQDSRNLNRLTRIYGIKVKGSLNIKKLEENPF